MVWALITVCLVAVTAWLAAKSVRLSRRVEEMEYDLLRLKQVRDQVAVLERQIASLQINRPAPAVSTERNEPMAREPAPERPPRARPAAENIIAVPVPTPASAGVVVAPEEEQPPSRTREEWEAFVGGKLLNRIGALALIIGAGLFLKHAFDENWISETLRVLIGTVVGLLCLAGADRTHVKGLKIFAQGLFGAGIAILYLSVYASFNFYALVPQTVAFLLMSLVTILTLVVALRYDSLAVALLGSIGGFLTPIMLSTGQSNEVGLFTYLALLNVGLLGTLLRKPGWIIIETLCLFSTWLLYFSWYREYYKPEDLYITVMFVVAFWLLFYSLDVFRLSRDTGSTNFIPHIDAGLNALILFGALYALVNKDHHGWMGGTSALVGLVYGATAFLVGRDAKFSSPTLARFLVTSVMLLAAATAIQFERFTTAVLWSLEAVLLFWWGFTRQIKHVWSMSLGLLACGAAKVLLTEGAVIFEPIREFAILRNERSISMVLVALASGMAAMKFVRRAKQLQDESLDWVKETLHFSWGVWIFLLLTVETNDLFRWLSLDQTSAMTDALQFKRMMILPMIWIVYSTMISAISLRINVVSLMIASLTVLLLSAFLGMSQGMTYIPITRFTPMLNVRAGSLILIVILALLQMRIHRHPGAWGWLGDLSGIIQVSAVIIALYVCTVEMRDFFGKQMQDLVDTSGDVDIADQLDGLRNLQQLSLSGVWLAYSVGAMTFGIWRSIRNIRIVAFVLFAITILKIFIYDLSFLETTYRITSFIALGVILLAVSYVYQRYKDVIFGAALHDKRTGA